MKRSLLGMAALLALAFGVMMLEGCEKKEDTAGSMEKAGQEAGKAADEGAEGATKALEDLGD